MNALNVLSLCDGMSCGQIALRELGIKVDSYYASEIKDIAIKATQTNFPNTIQIGDVTKVSYNNGVLHTENGDFETEIDMVIYGSPCFAKGTLVLTDKGYKEIQDVEVGDYVLSHDNKMHKVLNFMINGKKTIYEIKCQGAEVIRTTSNHRFYVREIKGDKNFGMPEWREIEYLKEHKNYYVGYAINQESKIPQWNGVELFRGHNKVLHKSLPLDNKDFWYIVGRFLGDGWVCKNYKKSSPKEGRGAYTGVRICCNKHQADELQTAIEKVFHVVKTEERTATKFQICNIELGYFLAQFGFGAKNKIVPNFVMDLPVDLLKSFLDGYFESDGCQTQKGIQYTTISRNLAYGIQHCIAKVYHKPCSFTHSKRPETHVIEGRTVNQNDTYLVRFVENPQRIHAFYEDGYLWMPIRDIKETADIEEVYDLTVEDAHSFTANGIIVHNCQSLSRAMRKDRKIGLEDAMRSGIFYECKRILKEINPKYFLMENVIMDEESESIITELMGVKPIRINASLVSAQMRDRLYWTNIPTEPITETSNITLQSILKDGYTPHDKAKCLCANDSHGYYNGCNWSPIKRFHRWYYKSFSTMIFPSKEDFERCLSIAENIRAGRPSSASLYDDYIGNDFDCARYLWKEERARLQGVDEKYVQCMTEQEAANLLGDGWNVTVIKHIFKGLNIKESNK